MFIVVNYCYSKRIDSRQLHIEQHIPKNAAYAHLRDVLHVMC